MTRPTKKQWLMWTGVVFGVQLATFTVMEIVLIGTPYWAELPYLPFQKVLCEMLGEAWPIGLWLGVIVGAVVYSFAGGLLLSCLFHNKKQA